MQFTRSEIREQSRFIDKSIEDTSRVLDKPVTKKELGPDKQLQLARLLARLRPAIHLDGKIKLPDNASEDSIPVVAIKPGDSVVFEPTITKTTQNQSSKIISMLDEWKTREPGASHRLVDDLNYSTDFHPLSVQNGGDRTAAIVGSSGYLPHAELDLLFSEVPTSAVLAKFYTRPVLMLSMLAGTNRTEPDVVAHELTHAKQRLEVPIRWFASQEDVNMQGLRDELEAYHTGSQVRIGLEGRPQIAANLQRTITEDSSDNSKYMQIIVDAVRCKSGPNIAEDPYMPSPYILSELTRLGMGGIIDTSFDFEAVHASFQS